MLAALLDGYLLDSVILTYSHQYCIHFYRVHYRYKPVTMLTI